MTETRKAKRKLLSVKIRYKSANVDEFVEHYSKDISKGGVFIKTIKPLSIGTLLKFEFQLRDQSSVIRGVGRVAWKRDESDANPQSPTGMGVKFVKMDSASRSLVHAIVDSRAGAPGSYENFGDNSTEKDDDAGFFSSVPPGAPIPNDDVTVVRHAGQFLESALVEGRAEPTAVQEAEAIASNARQRSLEIDAQRRAAAEVNPTKEVERMRASSLPPDFAQDIAAAVGNDLEDLGASAPVDLDFRTMPPPASVADELIEEIEGGQQAAVFSKQSAAFVEGAPAAAAQANIAQEKKKTPLAAWLGVGAILVVAGAAGAWYMRGNSQTNAPAKVQEIVETSETVVEEGAEVGVEEPIEEASGEKIAVPVAEEPPSDGVDEETEDVKAAAEVEVPKAVATKAARKRVRKRVAAAKKTAASVAAKPVVKATPVEKAKPGVYIVEVNTEPEGARVTVGGKVIQSTPGVVELSSMSSTRSVAVTKRGYKRLVKRIRHTNFVEEKDGYFVLLMTLDLEPLEAAKPVVVETPPAAKKEEPAAAEPKPAEAKPEPEPEPKPEPKPEPEEPESDDEDIDWS